MAQLVDGKWMDTKPAAEEVGKDGQFRRMDSAFRDVIGLEDDAEFPAEAGRYHLWVAWVCPWAGRALAVRALKGLEDVIGVSYAEPGLPKQGWTFPEGPDGPVEGGYPLHRLYVEHDPHFTGKVTVPTLWDRKTRRIVNNESSEIIRIFNSAFDDITGNRLDLYPPALRARIDQWNEVIYPGLNNGVYRAGFATSQRAYEEAARGVFEVLDRMEAHLGRHRYLAGEYCTEADWRAFTTLVRFDAAYFTAFKCNLRRLDDYPALGNYLRELFQWPGIAGTVNLAEIKHGYYQLTDKHRITAIGPELDLTTPHDRARLPGKGIMATGA
ncbi:putative glutathione S-transferase [Altererythrobacter atlanticus]|uniref:Glutathionyl-hydroquinone reductase YqjG n=1 Tax=Croceibacterium atlanticum TaxID=1267766 RepID=A0A0F7KSW0_9SPHN|nr:glutathione S-transferase family protein [Croceibacterium atlanticum]AKH42226.1 Glutathionyl-hydroquinone reductase YqjG [Croceibacterium atlanticum]MBB5733961.1 putative glutathione S-transferase [Croceibacterium atlanticum]